MFQPPVQLPKIERSDHFAVLIPPVKSLNLPRATLQTVLRRDMRPSCFNALGRWMTSFDWACILQLTSVQEKCNMLYTTLQNAVDCYLPARNVKVCTSDKPWVSSKRKRLVARRQHALKFYGKNSPLFKLLRAQVQEEVRNCKRAFYSTKVASLKDTNISRWWSEVKSLGGLSSSSEWWHQLLNSGTPSVAALCDQFNNFLHSLTSHFAPLDSASLASESLPVPPEFLDRTVN